MDGWRKIYIISETECIFTLATLFVKHQTRIQCTSDVKGRVCLFEEWFSFSQRDPASGALLTEHDHRVYTSRYVSTAAHHSWVLSRVTCVRVSCRVLSCRFISCLYHIHIFIAHAVFLPMRLPFHAHFDVTARQHQLTLSYSLIFFYLLLYFFSY